MPSSRKMLRIFRGKTGQARFALVSKARVVLFPLRAPVRGQGGQAALPSGGVTP